ncbi:hypothetical protein F5X97DRAFT_310967 [Nemania serpens]|nr:hypothetical protein F5X97DRAFT_310967 [Nemania serpens]
MGQTFQLVAPRAKLGISLRLKLGEILFEDAEYLVRRLIIPVRPQQDSSQNSSMNSTNTINGEKREVKRSRDDNEAHTKSSRPRKQIKLHGRSKKVISDAAITLSSLPPELHLLIFSFIGDITDIISLGITNQYFWSIGRERLDDYISSTYFGRWAGMNIVCVGEDVKPNHYPPGLFSTKELEVLRQETVVVLPYDWDSDDDSFDAQAFPNRPFTLHDFTDPSVSMIEDSGHLSSMYGLHAGCYRRGINYDPGYKYIRREFHNIKEETYLPTDQLWILRNLTTKEIVRSDAIALSPDYIEGPHIRVLGFGEVIMLRICWSTELPTGFRNTPNIIEGVWAGHCFDITTLSKHEAETRGEKWRDVSDEVAREIAIIWEGEFGPSWREIICDAKLTRRRDPSGWL